MKYKLQIDGAAEYTADLNKVEMRAPVAYPTINDIPAPVRAKFVEIHRTGQTAEYIADLFNVPKEWVVLVLEPPLGSSQH